mmetsp:Transcript_10631/g.29321  ORF Transcript_10631/g.29321 Transcript_10631/m.29321 type:complete len:242 (-) Transcript_10631:703-1428(-)|eukprot:CAMPEP_0198118530 /NCGR_PEP_ID=MMETSP1442-20131203/22030_1 /TAXON_ID= /ORGANISM="Craspedostauros australis, Strain CCMP3328" /LENGTH=241 /DNA_ID=CAMNT_0043776803 /DNA_START=52 /DNA_END=777 /DNA_ORIENTATION=-
MISLLTPSPLHSALVTLASLVSASDISNPFGVGLLCAAIAATSATLQSAEVVAATVPPPSNTVVIVQQQPTPVLEVIKVYGRLAGPSCYGSIAPKGSSCQVVLDDLLSKTPTLDKAQFESYLQQQQFQWPLKPYGIDKSLSKTAVMNKGAETRVYMEELERRGLYNPRNPAGPLPSSLRPKMNAQIQNESFQVDRVFAAMSSDAERSVIDVEQLKAKYPEGVFDYYDFLDLIGKETILWPY